MQKNNQARPMVLRELSLLRALGASRRTFRHRPNNGRSPLILPHVPQPDAFALPPARTLRPTVPDKAHESPGAISNMSPAA
jgi:hypothetical protein